MNQVLARGPDPPMGRGISWGHTWAYQVLLVVDKLNGYTQESSSLMWPLATSLL